MSCEASSALVTVIPSSLISFVFVRFEADTVDADGELGEDEDDAEGCTLDGELEPWGRGEGERGEGGGGDGEHVFGALEETAHLAEALGDGPVGCGLVGCEYDVCVRVQRYVRIDR